MRLQHWPPFSGGPPLEAEEVEDFDVEVKASEETVRAGQPLNISCIAPSGSDYHQYWLHSKKQVNSRVVGFFISNWFLCVASSRSALYQNHVRTSRTKGIWLWFYLLHIITKHQQITQQVGGNADEMNKSRHEKTQSSDIRHELTRSEAHTWCNL